MILFDILKLSHKKQQIKKMYQQSKQLPNYPQLDTSLPESDDEDDEEKRTIFCANLDQRVTEEILYEVFLQAGPIESVRIPKDNGGRQKSFGFITYVHKCTVPYALYLLSGLSLFRKGLTIKARNVQVPNLPSDCEVLQRRSGGRSSGSYDNFALRGNSFNSSGGGDYHGGSMNPFKGDMSPPATKSRRSDELHKHSSNNSRPHQVSPYSRSDSSRDHGRRSGGERQNRHCNDYRRSEQRNRHR